MRAVNLIPAEQRRGAGGLAGRSGGIVYVLTGGLAVLVVLGVVYALAVHTVADKKGDLAVITQQVNTVNDQAQALAPYVAFAAVSAGKVQEVTALAQGRFNWPGAMRQLALALPSDVTLTSFQATTGNGTVDASGAAGTGSMLDGCASSQAEVANVLTNLASVPGVDSVALTNTSENSTPSARSKGSGMAVGGNCPDVAWSLNVTYDAAYTVPDTKVVSSPSGAQTVSTQTSPPTVKTAAAQQSTGVTREGRATDSCSRQSWRSR